MKLLVILFLLKLYARINIFERPFYMEIVLTLISSTNVITNLL